jgi:glucose-1-phosphate adenylyltransferase
MQENERGYWEDVGSIDAYYESNRHVMARHPVFDLYNSRWPLHTLGTEAPPAKYVGDASEPCTTYGSLISNGWIISKAAVEDSLLFTCHDEMGVYSQGRAYGKVEKGAEVCESLLFGPNLVHHGAKVLRTILEKGVDVPEGVHTGHRLHWPRERKDEAIARDTARGFTISEGGVTVVPKGYVFR